ncbi:hypothetical protein PMIN03_000590 [Paraphaeosphaeria minitans]
MAVTSCASAELIAVSSLLTFDVYKAYVRPKATPQQLIFVSHIMICFFGAVMAVFACIWNVASIDLGWLFLVMGILIGGAVFPTAFSIVWKKQSRLGAISGCLTGLAAGLIAWFTTAYHYYGEITVASTGTEYATLAGCLASIMTGLIVTVTITYIKPDDFDWEITRAINAVATIQGVGNDAHGSPRSTPDGEKPSQTAPPSKCPASSPPNELDTETALPVSTPQEDSPSSLRSAFKLACISSFLLSFVLDFLLPMPMFFSHYIFSKGFFTAWVVISFIWVFTSSAISCFLPLWETRTFWGKLWRDVRSGQRSG